LLRDILRGEDEQIAAVTDVIAAAGPDLLVLQRFDYDYDLAALNGFADVLRQKGADYPFLFARQPNSGMATGLDMDGDGRLGSPRDAQGYGRFAGQGGMAVLSKYPILQDEARDFSGILWKDLPETLIPEKDGAPFPSAGAQAVQRLSSVAHWEVPVRLPDGTVLRLLAWHATPPVFDGPEDMNGRRNHDEAAFWRLYIEGRLGVRPADSAFVLLGDANLDPVDGVGRPEAISALLAHPLLQDPDPQSEGGTAASRRQGGANARQRGNPASDTVDWPDEGTSPGNMRVDYVLPSRALRVKRAGVFWPESGPMAATVEAASRHRLVWVDLDVPATP